MNLSEKEQKAFAHIFGSPTSDFVQGQQDCKAGLPARNTSKDYERGYGFQYQLEQMQSAWEYN